MSALAHPVSFVAKRELSAWPFMGRFLRAIGVRFVERRDDRRSLEDEASLVAQAERRDTLLFFPEGTFTCSAGLASFHLGAFRVACLAQRPVVPIALHGAGGIARWSVAAAPWRHYCHGAPSDPPRRQRLQSHDAAARPCARCHPRSLRGAQPADLRRLTADACQYPTGSRRSR
ncbi:lysophospholipid acyltransferase family protein [Paraburkholderia piptadeniae]|nr:lysophospholipid acyltransferase family protein [Paraburkholderia piptadeniae]